MNTQILKIKKFSEFLNIAKKEHISEISNTKNGFSVNVCTDIHNKFKNKIKYSGMEHIAAKYSYSEDFIQSNKFIISQFRTPEIKEFYWENPDNSRYYNKSYIDIYIVHCSITDDILEIQLHGYNRKFKPVYQESEDADDIMTDYTEYTDFWYPLFGGGYYDTQEFFRSNKNHIFERIPNYDGENNEEYKKFFDLILKIKNGNDNLEIPNNISKGNGIKLKIINKENFNSFLSFGVRIENHKELDALVLRIDNLSVKNIDLFNNSLKECEDYIINKSIRAATKTKIFEF